MTKSLKFAGLAAVSISILMISGCSSDGNGGGGGDLVATDLGQARIDGATTTIVAPPGWEGSETDDTNEDDNSSGGFNLGFDRGDDSGVSAPPTAMTEPVPEPCGTVDDSRDIEHPDLGLVQLQLHRAGEATGRGCVAAVSADGRTLLSEEFPVARNTLSFADPVTDAMGSAFFTYTPSRPNAIIVLVPTSDGYDFPEDNTTDYFWFTSLEGPGPDGNYRIRRNNNDCDPSCGDGTRTFEELTWDGSRYVVGNS